MATAGFTADGRAGEVGELERGGRQAGRKDLPKGLRASLEVEWRRLGDLVMPVGDKIAVLLDKGEEKKTPMGVIIPDVEDPKNKGAWYGRIVAMGKGKLVLPDMDFEELRDRIWPAGGLANLRGWTIPLQFGDRIAFAKHCGAAVEVDSAEGGQPVRLQVIVEDDVLAVLKG